MIDHAQRIKQRRAEDRRLKQMEEESESLFYLIVIVAALVACMLITEYHDAKKDAQRLSELLVRCANGNGVKFDGRYMECKLTSMVAGL